MSFNIGDIIVHEGSGVCRIDDIDDMELTGKGSLKTYYIMSPVYKPNAKVFSPVEGASLKLRPIADKFEMINIINNIDNISTIDEINDRNRQDRYKEVMSEFTPEALACVVKTILIHNKNRMAAGKKIMATDERILGVAGRKLYEEMAYTLDQELPVAQKVFEEAVEKNYSERYACIK